MVGTATAEALSHNRVNLEQVLVGAGGAIANLRSLVAQVAPKMANVLLQGESGTGKEVVARAIHDCSTRSRAPFVAVNCGAIPAELLESELFGHEKGAFTGAVAARKGRFELAEGGTLFLDEIGDMPFDMQVKLLRVLQERTFERVGGTKVQKANVRIVAATHQNLEGKVESGDFRMDLVLPPQCVPHRCPAIARATRGHPLLAQRFIDLQQEQNGEAISLSRDALTQLCQCEWQGNIRELGNLVERLTILYPGEVVDTQKLPGRYAASQADWVQTPRHDPEAVAKFIDDLFKGMDESAQEKVAVLPAPVDNNAEDLSGLFATADQLPPVTPHVVDFTIGDIDLKQHLAEIEKDLIFAALEHSDWVNAQAAKRLNLQRTTLVEKMRKYDISRT
jgi:sigma-54 specific flagellar transcriptional regulator A